MTRRGLIAAVLGAALWVPTLLTATPDLAAAHTGQPISLPPPDLSAWQSAVEFSGYGFEHILLGFDHLLFLAGLAALSRSLGDLLAILGIFALSYSASLIGGTLLGISVPGTLIDAIITLSVGFVGLQIAFSDRIGRLPDGPRLPALFFGFFHGLGLSSLLQELRLPGDDLLPSVLGFNLSVEVGQLAAIGAFAGGLFVLRAFPFPRSERIPAGFALVAASSVLFAFVMLGVGV